MLLKMDQKWDRLRDAAQAAGDEHVMALMDKVEADLGNDAAAQQTRFDSYLPPRPADEPHDKHCQVIRYGPESCCTCESNKTRRRQQIINAARANDTDFRATLGSSEAYGFDLAVKNKW